MKLELETKYDISFDLKEITNNQSDLGLLLWNFYLDSQFIYPEKLSLLEPNKEEVINTFNKLLISSSNTVKYCFVLRDKAIVGSMMTIQYTNDTWVIQHLAVLPKYRKTAVIKMLLLSINEWMIKNSKMLFFQNYFQPKTKVAYKTFKSMYKFSQAENHMSLMTLGYFFNNNEEINNDDSDISISDLTQNNYSKIFKQLTQKYHTTYCEALGLKKDRFDIDKAVKNFANLGLTRGRKYIVIKIKEDCIAVAVIDSSTVGINLSYFFDCIHLLIIDDSFIESTVQAINSVLCEYNKDIPILIENKYSSEVVKMGFTKKRTYMLYNLSSKNDMFKSMYNNLNKENRKFISND